MVRAATSLLTILLLTVAAFGETGTVRHVSDGDSFILASGERVRMIGVNAPELAEPFGPDAKDHLARLIRDKTVTLERDPQNDDRDRYGRLLRFVTVDGTDINHKMIADGYAYAYLRYGFDSGREDAYRKAERDAKSAGVGIWANAPFEKESAPTPAATSSTSPDPPGRSTICWPAAALVLLVFAGRFDRR